jgi:hypothetical protein
MGHDDFEVRKIGGQGVDRRRMRVTDAPPMPPGSPAPMPVVPTSIITAALSSSSNSNRE